MKISKLFNVMLNKDYRMSDDLEFAFLLEVHTAFKLPQTVLLGQYAQV